MTSDGAPPASGSSTELPSVSLVGQVLDARYRLVKKLGEGGMGEVYAAEHVHIEKRLAVKLLRPEIVSNKEAVSRFRQEARSASSIGHRNIIAIEDFGESPDGRIYMCMELLNGAPLNELIKQPLSYERLLNILIQTGHGLAAAHAKGIIHRDMKPENIFVTWTAAGEDVPKLLDFGIAKVAGNDGQNNLTRTGTIFGTPFYMAPEQALGTHVDHRADIYAMGVIMYEVFSGSVPFQGDSFMGILTQHITADAEPVIARAARAGRVPPPGVPEIIHKCMQRNPDHRFATMDDLVAALVEVYRVVAGAGMSSYMEAFPVGAQSSAHLGRVGTPPPAYTPPGFIPPTGALPVGASGPPGMSGHGAPYYPKPGDSTTAPPITGGYGYEPGSSSLLPQRKSRIGLIFALITVVVVVAGAVTFLVLGSRRSGAGADAGPSDATAAALIDAGAPAADATVAAGVDAPTLAVDAAPPIDAAPSVDAAEPDARVEAIDAGPVPAALVEVVVTVKPPEARLYDGGRALPGLRVKVDPRRRKRLTVQAPGYKSERLMLDGRDLRVSVELEREERPPPRLDCSERIVDRSNKACVKQFCSSHSAAMECLE